MLVLNENRMAERLALAAADRLAELEAHVAALEAENAQLRAQRDPQPMLTLKTWRAGDVIDVDAISYAMNRMEEAGNYPVISLSRDGDGSIDGFTLSFARGRE